MFYYILYYILLYLTHIFILLYLILYSSLFWSPLFSSPSSSLPVLSPSLSSLPPSIFLWSTFLLFLLFHSLYLPFLPSFSSSSLPSPLPNPYSSILSSFFPSFPSHLSSSYLLPFSSSNTLSSSNDWCCWVMLWMRRWLEDILTPHVLSEWMVEVCRFDKCGVRLSWCLVEVYVLSWCWRVVFMLLYIIILYIYYYTIIILYYILYYILYIYYILSYTILSFSFPPLPSLPLYSPFLSSSIFFLSNLLPICSSPSSSLFFPSLPYLIYNPLFSPSHSFYTCRCLLLDTYISSSSNHPKLTPHKLTEWMVEVWCV